MMKRSVVALGATLLLAAGATVGCRSDRSPVAPVTAPAVRAPNGDLLGGLVGTVGGVVGGVTSTVSGVLQLPLVNRLVPLKNDVTWSFVASPNGTTVTNFATGLTIVIPAGAVAEPTPITVTAKAGSAVNYQFGPHGLQFARPVTLRQSLGLLNLLGVSLTGMKGAYYSSPDVNVDPATGKATLDELEPSSLNLLPPSLDISIKHFSGYVVAYGRQ